jgi:hypothetical protein
MEHSNEEQFKDELKNKINNLSPETVLFDAFQFNTNEDLEYFILNFTKEDANNCIIQSLVAAYKRGAFTLVESEIISKSLRMLDK